VQVFDAESEGRCVASRYRRLSPNQGLYFPPPNQVRVTKPSNEKWEMAMHVHEAIFNRRSVREYADNAIEEPTIRRLIAAALQAPNAVNDQPWTFTVVRDRSLLDRISREAKAHMLATMHAAHADRFRSRLSDPDFDIFYRAPVLIVISASAQGPWIVEDCALAAQNLMLAAFAEQLGTCWIGFAQSYLDTAAGKAVLGLPWACSDHRRKTEGNPGSGLAQGSRNPLDRLSGAF